MTNQIASNQLLFNLAKDVNQLQQIGAQKFLSQSKDLLTLKHPREDWSVADCIEHLNEFCEYYIPQIETIVQEGIEKGIEPDAFFSSNSMGTEAINSVHPQNLPSMQTMGHFKGRDIGGEKNEKVINQFMDYQERLMIVLQKAQQTSLIKLSVPVRNREEWGLQLGDCFQYLIAHQILHTLQAMNLLEELTATTQD